MKHIFIFPHSRGTYFYIFYIKVQVFQFQSCRMMRPDLATFLSRFSVLHHFRTEPYHDNPSFEESEHNLMAQDAANMTDGENSPVKCR